MMLPPYDADGACPKCGHDQVNTYWDKDGHGGTWSICGCAGQDIKGEHLHRTCQRCKYEWLEATIAQAAEDA